MYALRVMHSDITNNFELQMSSPCNPCTCTVDIFVDPAAPSSHPLTEFYASAAW